MSLTQLGLWDQQGLFYMLINPCMTHPNVLIFGTHSKFCEYDSKYYIGKGNKKPAKCCCGSFTNPSSCLSTCGRTSWKEGGQFLGVLHGPLFCRLLDNEKTTAVARHGGNSTRSWSLVMTVGRIFSGGSITWNQQSNLSSRVKRYWPSQVMLQLMQAVTAQVWYCSSGAVLQSSPLSFCATYVLSFCIFCINALKKEPCDRWGCMHILIK